jgi:hypothetical protein
MDKETYLTHNALVFRVVCKQMFDFLPNILPFGLNHVRIIFHSFFSIFILTSHAVAEAQVIPFFYFLF